MTAPEPGPSEHVASLDGIRAIAVGLVILHHGWFGPRTWIVEPLYRVAHAGWAGVDVFFALSGFLITGILLRSRDRPSYWRNFYVRRALRILPLYWSLLAVVLLARAIAPPSVLDDVTAPFWVYFLFLSNFWLAWKGDPNDLTLDISWSLSIEEQFYLLWPATVWLLRGRALVVVLAGLVVAAAGARYAVADTGIASQYALTPCRIDALAIGALAAGAWHVRSEAAIRALIGVGLVALGASAAMIATGTLDRTSLWFGIVGYAAIPAATAGVILALVSGRWPLVAKALAWGPVRYVGKISYGLYLLHPTALISIKLGWGAAGLPEPEHHFGAAFAILAAVALGSLAMATLTWRTLEEPALALKNRLAPYR